MSRSRFTFLVRFIFSRLRTPWFCLIGLLPLLAAAEPVEFNLPAQPAAEALLAFSQQAKIEVLFSFDEMRKEKSTAVRGRYEPEDALNQLLAGTGFSTRRNARGKFIITPAGRPTGSLKGRLLTRTGAGASGLRVTLPEARQTTRTDEQGGFIFAAVPPGTYRLVAGAPGYQSLRIDDVRIEANHELILEARKIAATDEPTQLDPYVVQGKSNQPGIFDRSLTPLLPRTAVGNLDLPRTENDVLPYTIYDRDQITRSGVVDLNEFLQRAVLESDGRTLPQEGSQLAQLAGSSNLNLRGYGTDETVILINGRRLPEVMTGVSGSSRSVGPDVNFIPLSLVQQIEVLPVSSSALYAGNAFGGVINIVLRSGREANATEVTTSYTNALRHFDAPQSSVSLLNSQSLLDGKLHLLLSATFTRAEPPTEAELGYLQARAQPFALTDPIYRATPNIRSSDQTPLFGPGTPTVTSVAPGADGSGGLAAFANREGVRDLAFFTSPGGLAASPDSLDNPYGRQQQRSAYFGSAVYDLFPWLQLGLDGTYVSTTLNRGYDVLTADLKLGAASPFNPFQQDVNVSLNEIAPQLGANYSEARLDFLTLVGGVQLKLPSDWKVSLDSQYAHNTASYRGLSGADPTRWQQLVDEGLYNPLRDTQVHGPPQAFYDQVLVYYGTPGRFSSLGSYDTLDAAFRVMNQSLSLPTGTGAVNVGADYRLNRLGSYNEELHYGDGTLDVPPVHWTGRMLQRYSVFGELQGPLVPERKLPAWLRKIETDLAVRYVAADTARETNVAPTLGLKADFTGGLSFRGSFTTSNRVPTPQLSQPVGTTGSGTGINSTSIFDPLRNQSYNTQASDAPNPDLKPEAAVTQTAGLIFQHGKIHQFRVSLDFVDTRKTDEVTVLAAQDVLDLESLFPTRVIRAPLAPGDTHSAGLVTSVITGAINVASRHSQNWNAALDYAWTECAGGTLALYGRLVYFQRYDRQVFPTSPVVDELRAPDDTAGTLLKYRANFGASWSKPAYGFGLDGHYYHSRVLPAAEWPSQGGKQIDPYWQFDAFLQGDVGRWLPWKSSRYGLRGQLRVNNLFGTGFPKYANEGSGAGVQPYGDWRGRTYSLSLTATF
jgi:outer membrane receptor protein involved in Fe transport